MRKTNLSADDVHWCVKTQTIMYAYMQRSFFTRKLDNFMVLK